MLSKLQRHGIRVAEDNLTRQLYATDGSIYQITPRAIAFPRNAQEASLILQTASEAQISITPRGAGTGLAGGAIGSGLIVDFAKHGKGIHSFDEDRRLVRVGPGVVLDQLNRFLRPYGYTFGPDVATSSRATIGGMIGNNSSGARVPRYGTTSEHIESLKVITIEGKITQLSPHSSPFQKQNQLLDKLTASNHGELERIRSSPIIKGWPGYALHQWQAKAPNWPRVFCGSEGTLAGFLEAELRVVPIPKTRVLGLVHFQQISEAMEASVSLQSLDPTAVEHIDRILLDQTKGQLAFQAARHFLDIDRQPSEAILIVEFDSDVDDKLGLLRDLKLGTRTQFATQDHEMNLVWSLRKAGLSLLTGCKGAAKPTTGIEDAALPPDRLPEYVSALQKLLKNLDLSACFYGHAASGLLHVRPVVDLQSHEDRIRFRQLASEVSALVKEFKGSIAAEHGVGIARAEYLREQIDPQLFDAMKQVKAAFDPSNLMNPGKIFGDENTGITEQLRTTVSHDEDLPFRPQLHYAAKDESFTGHLNQCNGCGGCRKETATMCPTYLATGEESMSTRGRANLIRAAIDQRSSTRDAPLNSPELDHALSNCLACKACATECPSNVNLSLLKAELLNARYQHLRRPLLNRLISEADLLGKLGTLVPGLTNRLLQSQSIKRMLEAGLGLTSERPLPHYAKQRFDTWYRKREMPSSKKGRQVILWDDTFTRYHEPQIGVAAVELLESAGFAVTLIKQRSCCGRPAFSQGDLPRARQLAEHNLHQIAALSVDWPILFLEPSCHSMFVDDYKEFGLAEATSIAKRCFLLEEFMFDKGSEHLTSHLKSTDRPVAIHLHCHCKSILSPSQSLAYTSRLLPNRQVIDEGCCGMAGAFGALKDNYELSRQVATPLIETITALPPDTTLIASGTSCRQQISHLAKRAALHPVELLNQLKN